MKCVFVIHNHGVGQCKFPASGFQCYCMINSYGTIGLEVFYVGVKPVKVPVGYLSVPSPVEPQFAYGSVAG